MPARHVTSSPPVQVGPRADSARIVLRRLQPTELPAVAAHLLSLGPADRHARFHAFVDDAVIRAYVRRLDFARMILVGAIDPRTGTVVGLAEAHLDDGSAPARAELAVTVAAPWRGRGLGLRLAATSAAQAFARGAACVEFHFAADNRPLARLVAALGGSVDPARGVAAIGRPPARRGEDGAPGALCDALHSRPGRPRADVTGFTAGPHGRG